MSVRILSGRQAGRQASARRLPFTVGRAAKDDLRLDDPGVWDAHVAVRLGAKRRLAVDFKDPSLGESHELRNGETLSLGDARIRLTLSSLTPASSRARDAFVWFCLAAVAVVEIGAIYWLAAA